jgi:hypothetical protein
MAPGTSPSAMRIPTANPSDSQFVYYQDNVHQLHEVYWAGSGWGNRSLGVPMAPGTSPSAVRFLTANPNDW